MTCPTIHAAVVVGAGLSGLGAAKALETRGILPVILDAEERLGETWRRRHPQLRLNTHRRFSSLPGLPLGGGGHPYPHRDEVADYLTRYAQGLRARILHGTRLERLEREGDLWRLVTSRGDLLARNVVMATGVDRVPRVPDWPGRENWPGRLVHASDLGDVRQYQGQRVLVVGAGNSGCDVITHLLGIGTAELMVSVRHGPSVLPKWLGRFPMMRLTPLLARIPTPLLDPLAAGLGRLVHGDLRALGLPRHRLGLSRRLRRHGVAPAIDEGMVAALRSGRLRVVPPIARFTGDGIRLEDSRAVAPDVVIAATGYRSGLEPILGSLDVLTPRGVPIIHGGQQLPHAPGLFFTGMRPSLTGFFLASAKVGREIAGAIARREAAAHPRARPGWPRVGLLRGT